MTNKIRNIAIVLVSASFATTGCVEVTSTPAVPVAGQDAAQDTAEVVAQKATAGVGKKGQKIDKHSDMQKIISGPAGALFKVEQKVVFDIKIPHALQLYKATNGHFPKSHEDFMRDIVEANRIQLPELPEGAVYQFDTEKGELWVYPEGEVPNS